MGVKILKWAVKVKLKAHKKRMKSINRQVVSREGNKVESIDWM